MHLKIDNMEKHDLHVLAHFEMYFSESKTHYCFESIWFLLGTKSCA